MQSMPRRNQYQTRTWSEKDIFFIKTVQGYELNNVLTKGSKGGKPWREISKITERPESYCRTKWSTIKYNYLILKIMIHNERVTEDMVRNHLNTAKYLDGTLDFLDKYVHEIPNSEIPFSAHRFFDSAFGSSEMSGVDVEKLIKVEDNSAIIIKDYKQGTGTEPTSILPNIEDCYSITNTQETVGSLRTDEEVSEVYEIQDEEVSEVYEIQDEEVSEVYEIQDEEVSEVYEIQDEEVSEVYEIQDDEVLIDTEFGGRDALPKIQMKCNEHEDPMGKIEMNVPGSTGGRLRKLLMSNKNKKTSKNEMDSAIFARFLVKYKHSSTETEEDCDLKEYMNNVAELVCNRLTPRKRKYFLSEVDLIVSELLEGDNNK